MNGPAILRRALTAFIASTVLGGLLASGLVLPAAAAETHSLTVSVTNVTGTPLTALTVIAIPVSAGHIELDSVSRGSGFPVAAAVSGSAGDYRFEAIPAVEHTLYFATPTSTTFAQFLGGASDVDRAQVVAADTTTLSVSLASNSVVTGIVTSPAGKALSGAVVRAYYFNGSTWSLYTSAKTSKSGKYTLTDIDPGSYVFRFASQKGEYAPFYSGGVVSIGDATATNIPVASAVSVNGRFPKFSGSLTGKTTFAYKGWGSYPLDKARAIAYPVTGNSSYVEPDFDRPVYSAVSSKSGAWAIKNLAPGNYVVRLEPGYYNQPSLYLGSDGVEHEANQARVFTVKTAKATSTGRSSFNVGDNGASITFTARSVYDSYAPIEGVEVRLERTANPAEYYEGMTKADGTVVFGRVGKNHVIQPGEFSYTVTSQGRFQSGRGSRVLVSGANTVSLAMYHTTPQNYFYNGPKILETKTAVGTTYAVSYVDGHWAAEYTHQWLRNGYPIYGADQMSYTSTSSDLGAQLSVRIRVKELGYDDVFAYQAVAGVVTAKEAAPFATSQPLLSPAAGAFVGTTLRVSPGTWSTVGLTYDYRWLRDGVEFANDGPSYVVTLADLESRFTVEVTAHKTGYPTSDRVVSTGLTPTYGSPISLTEPLIVSATTRGVAKGSTKFTVPRGEWSAPDPGLTYVWLQGGTEVGSGATYTATSKPADLAQTLEVLITARQAGFDDGTTRVTARKAKPALAPVGAPVATGGSVTVGDTVTVSNPGDWAHGTDDLGEVSYTYQWKRSVGKKAATSIAGATGASYVTGAVDAGARLSVVVTAVSTRWSAASTTVNSANVVTDRALVDASPALTVTGSPAVGDKLVGALTDAWATAGAKVTYQWWGCAPAKCAVSSPVSKYTKIAGATSTTLVVPTAYAKGRVSLVATATKAGFAAATAASVPTAIVAKDVIPVLSAPAISDNMTDRVEWATIGRIHGSFQGTFGRGAEQTGQLWQMCSADCLSPDAVWTTATGGNATDSQFTPDGNNWREGSSYLRLKATAAKRGYTSAVAYSTPISLHKGEISTGWQSLTRTGSSTWTVNEVVPNMPSWATKSVQWWVDDTAQAPGSTYTVVPADAGKAVYAAVTWSAVGFNDAIELKTVQARSLSELTARPVAVLGTSFDDLLTLSDPVPWDLPQAPHADWRIEYDWWGANPKNFFAIADPTYTPVSADVGQIQRVSITAHSPLYGQVSTLVSAPARLLPGAAFTLEGAPALAWDGELLPKSLVSVSTPRYSATGVQVSYTWQSSTDGDTWTTIKAASGSSYRLALTDSAVLLRVIVTGSKPGYTPVTTVLPVVQVLEGDVIRQLSAPHINGSFRVGEPIQLDSGAWSRGTGLSVQWMLNDRAIPGATSNSYTPLAVHVGDELHARVTATAVGKLDVVVVSNAVVLRDGLAPVATKAPAITGTTTLTATTGTWNTSGLTFTFEWSRAGEVVGTASTIDVEAGFTKADYRLTVRTTRFGYESGSWIQP